MRREALIWVDCNETGSVGKRALVRYHPPFGVPEALRQLHLCAEKSAAGKGRPEEQREESGQLNYCRCSLERAGSKARAA